MSALKAHEVARYCAHPDLTAGIFLVYGPDAGLVRETGRRLVRYYAGDDAGSMGLVTLEGSELDADPGRLAVEAGTGSLFGERRVVRVRGAGKGLVMTLTELKDDPGNAVIVLEAGNLVPRDALRALVEAAPLGRALPCYPDSDETLIALIGAHFAKAGIRTDPDVAPTLRDLLGNDRQITLVELDKLTLFADNTKRLTRADVVGLCADNAALALDQIADAAGTGHAEKLDEALSRALSAAINPQQILAAGLNHFSTLRRWRSEIDAGRTARQVLDGARPRPHFSRRSTIEQQLRGLNEEALASACRRLYQAIAETRQHAALAETSTRRALLAVAMLAAGR